MNEAFWRIQKLSSIPSKSEKWDLQFGSGPRASRAQGIIKKRKYVKNTSWNVLEHCFVMNEEFWRIQKLSSIPPKSGNRDLQFGSGPRASRAQEIKKRNYLKKTSKNALGRFGTLFCHEWGVLEDSEALVDTIKIRKMRSTIWEWSQSVRSSKNKEKIGNTSKQLERQ